jgi:hypothetical protein
MPATYYAKKRIRWGDAWLEPGAPVPAGEPGRDYASAVAFGDLVEVPETTDHATRIKALEAEVKSLRQEMKAMTKSKGDEPAADAAQVPDEAARERSLGEPGIVGSNPPVPDGEEAAAGFDDLDHAGGDAPVRGRSEADDAAIKAATERQAQAGEESVKAGQAPVAEGPAAVAQQQAGAGIDVPAGADQPDAAGEDNDQPRPRGRPRKAKD